MIDLSSIRDTNILVATDEPSISAEVLADKAAGFHPMAKPVKAVKEHPGPQKHDAGAVPVKALRIGWER